MLMLMIIFVIIASVEIFYYVIKPLRYWKNRGVEQGNPIWIFGHYWQNFIGIRNGVDTFMEIYKQTSNLRYFGFYRFSHPALVVRDPELIHKIMVKDFHAFMDQTVIIPTKSDPLWAKTLYCLTGSKWKHVRTRLNPCFSNIQISCLFSKMVDCTENFVSHILNGNQETTTLEIGDLFSRYANDLIATTVFGIQINSLTNRKNEFYEQGNTISNVSTLWKMFGIKLLWFMPVIANFVKVQIVSDKPAAYFRRIVHKQISKDEKGPMQSSVLHFFVETLRNGRTLEKNLGDKTPSNGLGNIETILAPLNATNEDVTAHALYFFIAGLEPIASSISFIVYELALNPKVQEKLRQEIFATLKECKAKPTFEVISSMKYMDMVVSESLRKWPPITITARDCTKLYTIEPVLPGEKPVQVEEGVEIKIPLHAIHHDPKYFPNPELFDPERFSEKNKDNIKPFTYLPFGLGPRNCIGVTFSLIAIKVTLFHLLSHVQIVPVEKTVVPLRFHQNSIFNLKPVGGIWIGLRKYTK